MKQDFITLLGVIVGAVIAFAGMFAIPVSERIADWFESRKK